MPKNKHHTVPRFYLNAFASAPRRIHVLHLSSNRIIRDAGLRDQCYKHRFYGKTDEVENALMQIEAASSRVIRRIIDGSSLSNVRREELQILRFFIALQRIRTPKSIGDLKASYDEMTESMKRMVPPGADTHLIDGIVQTEQQAIASSLLAAPDCCEIMSDLTLRLVVNRSPVLFITSDNPVAQYNQYCEQVLNMGVAAPSKKGFQLFFPISPHLALFLYDGSVYRVLQQYNGQFFTASEYDARMLNLLQAINADRTLLFSLASQSEELAATNKLAAGYRKFSAWGVEKFCAKDDANRTLFHAFQQVPNIKLRLSFLDLRRKARRTPLPERPREREHALSIMDRHGDRHRTPTGVRTFHRVTSELDQNT